MLAGCRSPRCVAVVVAVVVALVVAAVVVIVTVLLASTSISSHLLSSNGAECYAPACAATRGSLPSPPRSSPPHARAQASGNSKSIALIIVVVAFVVVDVLSYS